MQAVPTSPDNLLNNRPDPFARRARLLLWLCFGITAVSGLLSSGVYHEDDLKHFLYARWTPHDAHYLIDGWGRPGFTVPYALPAMIGSPEIGWHACRLLSAILSAATAWLAYRIARHYQLRHAWLAIPIVYLQPLFTHLTLTTLTETPLAFYFAMSTWLILKNKPTASAAVMALAPVTRHEAIVLLPIWAIALWRFRSSLIAYPMLLWALLLHNLAGAAFLENLPVSAFFKPNGANHYGHGTPLTYIPRLLFSTGPVVVAASLLGIRRTLKCKTGWIVVASAICYFAAETAIYMRGAYSSGGYARFLVPITPWIAILALAGIQPALVKRRPTLLVRTVVAGGFLMVALWALCEIEWWWRPLQVFETSKPWTMAARIATLAFCAAMSAALAVLHRQKLPCAAPRSWRFVVISLALLTFALPVWAALPLRLRPQHHLMRDAADEISNRYWNHRPLIAVNYWMHYWTNNWVPHEPKCWHIAIDEAEPGALFAWDARFCLDDDFGFTLEEMAAKPGWRLEWISSPDNRDDHPFLALFERQPRP